MADLLTGHFFQSIHWRGCVPFSGQRQSYNWPYNLRTEWPANQLYNRCRNHSAEWFLLLLSNTVASKSKFAKFLLVFKSSTNDDLQDCKNHFTTYYLKHG
jgi:hypothetical protein